MIYSFAVFNESVAMRLVVSYRADGYAADWFKSHGIWYVTTNAPILTERL